MEMSQIMESRFQEDVKYISQGMLKILQDELGKDAITYHELLFSGAQVSTIEVNGDIFSIEFFLSSDFEDDRNFGIYITNESDPEYAIHEYFKYPISEDSIIDYIVNEVLK